MKKLLGLVLMIALITGLVGCAKQAVTEVVYDEAATETVETAIEETEEAVEEVEEAAETEETANEETEVMASDYPMTIVDKFGNDIVIEKAPEKVISLSPEITEIIFAVGGGDLMVGRSSYCDYPEASASVEEFGSVTTMNLERVVEVSPDVIFLSSMAPEESVNMLTEQGLTVVAIDKDSSLQGTYDYFNIIGGVLNKKEQAANLAKETEDKISAVAAKVEGLEKPTLYYVVYAAEGYDSTATGDTFIHDIIETAGAENVAKDATDWMYSVEKLVEDDPDMLVCSMYWDTKLMIQGLPGYSDLTAVVEDRLYVVDENIFFKTRTTCC